MGRFPEGLRRRTIAVDQVEGLDGVAGRIPAFDQRNQHFASPYPRIFRSQIHGRDRRLHDRQRRAVGVRHQLDVVGNRVSELTQRGQDADTEAFGHAHDRIDIRMLRPQLLDHPMKLLRRRNAGEVDEREWHATVVSPLCGGLRRDLHPRLDCRRPDDRDRCRATRAQPLEQECHRRTVIAGHDRGGLGHVGGHELGCHDRSTGFEDRACELVAAHHVGHHESVDVEASRFRGREVGRDERNGQLSVFRALDDADGEIHVVLHEVHAAGQPEADRPCARPSKIAGSAVGRVAKALRRLEHAGSRLCRHSSTAGQCAGRRPARDPGEIGDVLQCRRRRRWHVANPLHVILCGDHKPILHNRLRICDSSGTLSSKTRSSVAVGLATRLKDSP